MTTNEIIAFVDRQFDSLVRADDSMLNHQLDRDRAFGACLALQGVAFRMAPTSEWLTSGAKLRLAMDLMFEEMRLVFQRRVK